ncbi:uncharacterized protein LOC118479200, partial [Aplysia californica]|uniref:Uncharacterized protein LOC118479200 n=1 Tax=Aplysia californica TaxID=6500 RepID=A0ABM1W5C1_APLCA
LLEKLVARVVSPYLGQRGVYEGGPDPIIKVKLKPIPFNFPSVVVQDENRLHPKTRFLKGESQSTVSPLMSKRGDNSDVGVKKLKPVLEHVYDGGRRHSIIS